MFAHKIKIILSALFIIMIGSSLFFSYDGMTEQDIPTVADLANGSFSNTLEAFIKRNIPFKDTLTQISLELKLLSGKKEQNSIFIAENRLIENTTPPDNEKVAANVKAMQAFVQKYNRPTYAMLIPTACAVLQRQVPDFATLFNQKELIDSIYREISGILTAVDVYPTLFNHQDESIFYCTDTNLTGQGGYYIYSTLCSKLGLEQRGIEQFDIQYLSKRLYGDLYERSPYKPAEPDLISLYHFTKFDREYMITHTELDGKKKYFSLYPEHLLELSTPTDIIFGGISPIMDIKIYSPFSQTLLLFADKTMQSYLPFLLVNYGNITVVDLETITPQLLDTIDVDSYSQVLFAYSMDTFMHNDCITKLIK